MKGAEQTGITLYDGAAVYALVAGGTADPAAADRHAAEAVRLLGRAAAAGYLDDPAQVDTLRAADEYAALRRRPDYRKLLADLDGKRPRPPELAPPPRPAP